MIDAFTGQYSFLSNFYPIDVEFEGITYPSAEHAYQASKSNRRGTREFIARMKSPAAAKRFGQTVNLRHGWDEMKLAVMEDILRAKFGRPNMRRALIATHPHELVEGNWWGDVYWGVCGGRGENHLGRILVKIREESRA